MTRGNEGELVRVPSQGNEFDINISFLIDSNSNQIETFKYMSPDNSIQLDKLKILIQNNFNSMNPYIYDENKNFVIDREKAEKIKGYTPIEEQLNILINTYNMEFYRTLIKNGKEELWLIKICTPSLRSSITVELDTMYLFIHSVPWLKDAKSCIAKPREALFNINSNYDIQYAKHPHVGNSGKPCLGQYEPRLSMYVLKQGSIVGYFTTLKQWANTNNGRDAFWSLSNLINKVRGGYLKIKKKRGDGYMDKRINHILPFKLVHKMVAEFEKYCSNKYIRSFYPDEGNITRNEIWKSSIYTELIQHYVDKYNSDPNNFTYDEEEMLGRAETYTMIAYALRAYIFKYTNSFEDDEKYVDNFNNDYINGHSHPIAYNLSRSINRLREYKTLDSTIDKYGVNLELGLNSLLNNTNLDCEIQIDHVYKGKDVIPKMDSLHNLFIQENLYNGIDEQNDTIIDRFYGHKNVFEIQLKETLPNINLICDDLYKLIINNKRFIDNIKTYLYLLISLQFNSKHIQRVTSRKVLQEPQLFKLKHWFNKRELNALCKRYTASDKTRKSIILKELIEQTFPNKRTLSQYEDILIRNNWYTGYNYSELYDRSQSIYDYQSSKYMYTPITVEEYKSGLKLISNMPYRLKYFNYMMDKWNSEIFCPINNKHQLFTLRTRLETILENILYEWSSMTKEIQLKEVKNAVEKERERESIEDALREERKERAINTAKDVSKDTVSINKIPNKGMVRPSVVQVQAE